MTAVRADARLKRVVSEPAEQLVQGAADVVFVSGERADATSLLGQDRSPHLAERQDKVPALERYGHIDEADRATHVVNQRRDHRRFEKVQMMRLKHHHIGRPWMLAARRVHQDVELSHPLPAA